MPSTHQTEHVPLPLANLVTAILQPAGLNPAEVISAFYPAALKKGEYFVKPGNPHHRIAFIDYGVFVQYRQSAKGEEVVEQFSFEGEFTGDISNFYKSAPSDIFIKALDKARLFCLDRTTLLEAYRHSESANYFGRVMAEQGFAYLHDRFISLLIDDAETRYLKLFSQRPSIFLRVPQKYIASYLGMTRETLSRIRAAGG